MLEPTEVQFCQPDTQALQAVTQSEALPLFRPWEPASIRSRGEVAAEWQHRFHVVTTI